MSKYSNIVTTLQTWTFTTGGPPVKQLMDFGLKDVQSHSDASTPTASSAIFVLQYVSLYSFLQQQDFNLSEEEKKKTTR